ncbi:GAF domain-containing protein [Nocardia pneumoniae]|uniref:GAF domain-containing protein n=1 Tax=Nocardia pneumoniae TaxID=228601 RepID=UPI00030AC44B|nr:GAF domain-containing protein [Nocardia pneumoniae]
MGSDDRRPPPHERLLALVLRPTAPPALWGLLTAAALIALEIIVVQQLRRVAPDMAFGAIFLFGVMVVSASWGFPLALCASLASAVAYVYFHSAQDGGAMVPAVVVFLILSVVTNVLVGQARLRARESEQRRREADLAAELARLVLRAVDLPGALAAASERITQVLELPPPGVVLTTECPEHTHSDRHQVVPLRDSAVAVGALLIPRTLSAARIRRVQRMVPSLEALLSAARDHDRLSLALRSSRKELERFFALTSELLGIGDGTGFSRVNPAFTHVLGYNDDQLRHLPLTDLIHADDRARTRGVLADVLANDATAQWEARCLRADGTERWLEWSIVGDQGTLFATARDVTERRQEQNRLQEAQRQLEHSHAKASALARQQTALRRVATVVARRADPADVCPLVVTELANSLDIEHVSVVRYEPPHSCLVVAAYDHNEVGDKLTVGERLRLGGNNVSTRVFETGRPAEVEDYDDPEGPIADRLRRLGLRSGLGVPIEVDNRLWGALVIAATRPEPVNAENRIRATDFADLIATAIYNSETRAALTASRARIVAAADQARRGIERDLHDGAQQRIVSLGLELRAAEAAVPPDNPDLRRQLGQLVDGLSQLYTDLQELSRGIHPAILSRGGLAPALKALARRSQTPVRLDVALARRLPESVEVAAYYVVAEALTNTTKYARATEIHLHAGLTDSHLELGITDNGIGGATMGAGSGLIGLKDRVEALDGTLEVLSTTGTGTTISARIPVADLPQTAEPTPPERGKV